MFSVERGQEVELRPALTRRCPGRKRQVWNAFGGDTDPLIARGQEPGRPGDRPAILRTREKDDERRQILGLASQAVSDPGTQTRTIANLAARRCQVLGRRMDRTGVPAASKDAEQVS